MQMFEKAEADYRALSEKKRIIENDKAKIHKVRACLRSLHMCQVSIILSNPCTSHV